MCVGGGVFVCVIFALFSNHTYYIVVDILRLCTFSNAINLFVSFFFHKINKDTQNQGVNLNDDVR